MTIITCARCGRTTTDPDKWDPERETGIVYCDACWPHRLDGPSAESATEGTDLGGGLSWR